MLRAPDAKAMVGSEALTPAAGAKSRVTAPLLAVLAAASSKMETRLA
jgi:hypothetical protein